MKHPETFKSVEALLGGTIRQPSPSFEEALRRIPAEAGRPQPKPLGSIVRVLGIAAAILLTAWAGLNVEVLSHPGGNAPLLEDDPSMMTLFVLAEDLEPAAVLLDGDHLAALDYLTSTP